jgi:hypothetical protein
MISPLLVGAYHFGPKYWDHYSQFVIAGSKVYENKLLSDYGIDRIICREIVMPKGPLRAYYKSDSAHFGRPTGNDSVRIIFKTGLELRPSFEKHTEEDLIFIPAGNKFYIKSGGNMYLIEPPK